MKLRIGSFAVIFSAMLSGGGAFADDGKLFLAASAGVVEYVGDASDIVSTGGGVVLGAGLDLTEHLAAEVEGYGAWADISGFGLSGDAESYGILFGPKVSTAISEASPWGAHVGANFGFISTSASACGIIGFSAVCVDSDASGFAWSAKVGLDRYFSESLQFVADVRYSAIAEHSDDGSLAVMLGIRFYPGF